jgi:uncharacterized membrane protein (UPF0127 family)
MRWVWRGAALVLVLAGIVFIQCGANRPKDPVLKGEPRTEVAGFGEISYRIDAKASETRCALLADTPEQHRQGLMNRRDLAGHAGMLFRFATIQNGAFWMKDTIMPLSIAYFGDDGAFVSSTDMEPCLNRGNDCPAYPAGGPYRYALEVKKGGLGSLGIGPGAHLLVGAGCT